MPIKNQLTEDEQASRAYKRSTSNFGLDESWMQEGECARQAKETGARDTIVNMFYNERNRTQEFSAKRLCSKCNVKGKCLHYALTAPHDNGIWGGTTPRERFKIRRGYKKMEEFVTEGTKDQCEHTVSYNWLFDADPNSVKGTKHRCPKCLADMKIP